VFNNPPIPDDILNVIDVDGSLLHPDLSVG